MADDTTTAVDTTTTEDAGELNLPTSREEAGSDLNRNAASSSLLDLNEQEVQANEEFKVPDKFLKDGQPDVENLVKSYTELENKIRTTRPNAPATAEEYKYDYPDGFDVDDKSAAEFRTEAHEKGLSQEQYQWVMNEYFDVVSGTVNASTEIAETQLKETWGDDFDDNLGAAKLAWKNFGGELDITAVGNNPVALQVLAKIGATLKEDGVTSDTAGSVDLGLSDEEMYTLQNHPNYWESNQMQEKFAAELGRRRKMNLPAYRP